MNKVFKYIGLGLMGSLLAVSCDISNMKFLNKLAEFDDADAFVAFDQKTFSINEDSEATASISVTLASVAGIEETISYKVVDGTAKQGVNYEMVSTSGVLTFDKYNRTQTIEFKVMPDGQYTGDLKFQIVLNEGATVGVGHENTCTITINDIDHPLSALLGSYTMSADNYWNGPFTFPMEIRKDANDDHKVWFFNIFGVSGWAADDMMYYGNVNDDMTSINLPFGQEAEYHYSGTMPVLLLGFDGSNGYDQGSMDIAIVKDAEGNVTGLDFGDEWGIWIYIDNAGNLQINKPGMYATKD